MKCFNSVLLFLCFLSLCFNIGCKSEKPKLVIESLNAELMRGDIILCYGNQFGQVNYFVSYDTDVRDTFNLGMALLHSFEYDEAKKAFSRVIEKDPQCVMAYWGLAMSYLDHPRLPLSSENFEKGSKILKIAETLPKTKKEQGYLEGIGAYFNADLQETAHRQRALRMEKKMEKLYKKYPEDKEAAVFFALSLFATDDPTDKTFAKQRKAGAILESLFPEQPNHPGIAHYIIHHYDSPELAKMALPTARKYAEIAPSSAHAQHMPSHIFTRLGLWGESILSNINSISAAQCYAEESELDGNWYREIHALDYLVYAYLQKGDNINAEQQFRYWQSIEKISPRSGSAYNFIAIPVRMALENKIWARASRLQLPRSGHQWESHPWEKSLLHFARALGNSYMGNLNQAEEELTILKSLQEELTKKDVYKANQVLIQVIASEA